MKSLLPLFSRVVAILVVGVCFSSNPIAVAVVAQEAKPVKVPDVWKATPGAGFVWYRAWAEVPEGWRERDVRLFVECADDAREMFVNGRRVGATGEMPPAYRSGLGEPDRFAVPADLLQYGRPNLIAVRIFLDQERRTGFNVAAPILFGGPEAIRLEGNWQSKTGDDSKWGAGDGVAAPPAEFVFSKRVSSDEALRLMKKLSGEEGPRTPAESAARFKTFDDLEVELVLSEPEIGQPLQMSWDERGRLWVVQFRQYPNPAGLKMVSRDKFLRAVYDKTPPAPPNHFRGADKVTVHEDTDGDGKLDKHSTFVDGLSLVSSVAFDAKGVWVLNPPYLLFYPDADQDGRPDGDPEVHLEGFGLEDSHSIANSLRWGPDGWLYAGQGSTVSGAIRRPGLDKQPNHSMGQVIWRYHPATKRYEVFAEGGGNTFGVEIDSEGRLYSGHNGGDTRGFHFVQGGYYQKGFGKHGALSNPYSFGYFPAMAHPSVPRFTHTFVLYDDPVLPAPYRGRLFGVEPLQGRVVYSEVSPDRSSFKTKDLGHALTTDDTWFRPIDIKVGPDGWIYVADMYEQRIDHASHYQGRVTPDSGRIYRLKPKGATSPVRVDYRGATSEELVRALQHPQRWHRQTALRLLGQRRDPAAALAARKALEAVPSPGRAVDLLWGLAASGGLDEAAALALLGHDDPFVRLWVVRIVGDSGKVSPAMRDRLAELAYRDPHVQVRSQLASTARRLPAADCLAIVRQLAARGEDVGDIHVPLLVWWAVESKAETDREAVVALFRDQAVWSAPLMREHLLQRLMRRYAAAGTRKDLLACASLLELAPSADDQRRLMAGFEEAFQGRSLAGLPDELVRAIAKSGGASLPLRLRQGEPAAVTESLRIVGDSKADAKQRRQLIEVLGQAPQAAAVDPLLSVVRDAKDDSLRSAALTALLAYDQPRIASAVLEVHGSLSPDVRAIAQSLLASRKPWALEFIAVVESGKLSKEQVPAATVKKLLLKPDEQLAAAVKRVWGEVQGETTAAMRQQVERLAELILQGSGNPYNGKQLYAASCGKCHRLFEDGGRIGPELTSYKRDDLRRMLLNVVNPSAEIREGFENYVLSTDDGRTLSGFLADQDAQVVSIRGADGQTVVVARDEIEELRAVPVSLMPEGLLRDLSEQQVRDLFAYLRATQPLP